MRVVKNPKPVSVVVGGTLMIAGFLGLWLAAIPSAGPGDGRRVVFAFFFAVVALVHGAFILSWIRRSGRYLDWLRWQNFGAGTLLISILCSALYFSYPLKSGAFAPLIVVLALAQATVSIWRIIEQHQLSKSGVHLSGLQISWLRVIHISRGHEAAVRELRTMYPKIGPLQADTIIENLYRTEEEPPGFA